MLDAENAQGRVRLVGIRANMEDGALRLTEIGEATLIVIMPRNIG